MANDVMYTRATELLSEYTPDTKNTDTDDEKQRDEALYVLHTTSGWGYLKQMIEDLLEQLEPNVKEGDSIEAVGYKYLAVKTAKLYLQAVVDEVETTYERIQEERDRKSSTRNI